MYKMEIVKTRFDKLKLGDKVFVGIGDIREVTFIGNDMMGINWHSISLSTPEGCKPGHLIGHEHDVCDKIIDL